MLLTKWDGREGRLFYNNIKGFYMYWLNLKTSKYHLL